MKKEFLWLDGWKSQNQLPLGKNRAFLFGDGFFESIRFNPDKTALFWPFHWERIQKSVAALRFPWPADWDEATFSELIRTCISTPSSTDARVRIQFFRAGEGRYTPESSRLGLFIQVEPLDFPWVRTLNRIGISSSVYIEPSPFGWIKSTSALPYILAGMECREKKLDDLLLCNREGWAVEGTFSSLSWSKGGIRYFPSPGLGGLDSCFRRFLQKDWIDRGIPFSEVCQTGDQVLDSDWVSFGSGTGLRIWLRPGVKFPMEEFRSLPFDYGAFQ